MLSDSIIVEAFDEEWNSIGVFESMSKASRVLYISSATRVWMYIHKYGKTRTFKRKQIGVKSYKTGKRYHFKVVKHAE